MMTKKDLLDYLKNFPNDIPIEVGVEGGEAGTQREILSATYVTGAGRGVAGGRAVVLLYEFALEPAADEDDPEIKCPHCGEEL